MEAATSQEISVSLSAELIEYAERYQKEQGLASRSDVIARALRALREHELAEGYRAWAEDSLKNPDPLVEAGTSDGLETSTGNSW